MIYYSSLATAAATAPLGTLRMGSARQGISFKRLNTYHLVLQPHYIQCFQIFSFLYYFSVVLHIHFLKRFFSPAPWIAPLLSGKTESLQA